MATGAVFSAVSLLIVCLSRAADAELCTDDVCEYELEFHWRSSMTYHYTVTEQALPVALNGSNLVVQGTPFAAMIRDPMIGAVVPGDSVLTGDGTKRDFIVVNGQLPGPTIEVMKGAQVVIHVKNRLVNEELTIHWHGQYQRDTPFMDGVHGITQCGIPPGKDFTYRFTANPAGTHWYHSHYGIQMLDGGSGMIIVREEEQAMPEHQMFVSDLFEFTATEVGTMHPFEPLPYRGSGNGKWMNELDPHLDINMCDMSAMDFNSALINYKGRPGGQYPGQELFPLSRFEVTAGERSRFRVVSSAAEYAFELSVDGHKMHIVAMDGHEMQPITADSYILAQGETVDFELDADQTAGLYWVRAETLHKGGTLFQPSLYAGVKYETRAVLSYNPALTGDPASEKTPCTAGVPCVTYNCPFASYPADLHKTCIGIDQARSPEPVDADYYGLDDPDVTEHWINAGIFFGGMINGKRFIHPENTIYGKTVDQIPGTCDELCAVPDPDNTPCYCTQVLDLPLATTIQMVIYNKHHPPDTTRCYHHLMHLHGYGFAILAAGFGKFDEVTGAFIGGTDEITCMDPFCMSPMWNGTAPALNLVDPPIRDSINLPAGGYAVIRFKTNNPGYWLFHCHQILHHHDGMVMVMNVAPGQHPPAPPGFPTCENFEYSAQQYEDALQGKYNTVEPEPTDDMSGETGETGSNEEEDEEEGVSFSTEVFAGIIVGAVLGGIILGALIGACVCKSRS